MIGAEETDSPPEVCRPADPVVEFFNQRARDYDREYNDETPGGFALRIRREKVMTLFDRPGGKVLDVGCGPGVMAESILSRGCSFWGADPSEKMIEIGRSRFPEGPRVQFACMDALRLSFPDGFFDAVLCMGVIDALQDRRGAVREMLRVLKPNGILIITFTNFRNPYAWWKGYVFYPVVGVLHGLRAKLRQTNVAGRRAAGKTRKLYTTKKAHELLISEGAAIRHTMGYYYNPFLSPLDEIMPSLALAATRKLEKRAQARPDWLAAGLIVKAQKLPE
jgi:ubiquinone/menaquinone biosynthesis C-methylase UbiE